MSETVIPFIDPAAGATAVVILVVLILWSLVWKGIALWKAARLSHKWWFFFVFIINTAGILEIIYIFLIAKKSEEQHE